MKKFYEGLFKEIERNGELERISREKIWDKFENIYGEEEGKKKRQELELNSLKKVQESWKIYTPIPKVLMKQVESILGDFLHHEQNEIEKKIMEFYKECEIRIEKEREENIYIYYLKQAIRYLEILQDEASLEEENEEDIPLKNGDLEIDEYDTSYCAGLMWKYQEMEAGETTRKKREIEFWEWYVKEAARLLNDPITEDIKIESSISEESSLQITCAQNFVRAIASELDYIKHEKIDEKKILIIHTCKNKKGLTCPKCGVLSEHIKISSEAVSELGKFKGWTVKFRTGIHFYYCDNKECSEKDFPERTQTGLNEKKANFLYITKQKENEEIISKIFDL